MNAMFLRHEGYLGALGCFLKAHPMSPSGVQSHGKEPRKVCQHQPATACIFLSCMQMPGPFNTARHWSCACLVAHTWLSGKLRCFYISLHSIRKRQAADGTSSSVSFCAKAVHLMDSLHHKISMPPNVTASFCSHSIGAAADDADDSHACE